MRCVLDLKLGSCPNQMFEIELLIALIVFNSLFFLIL